MSMLGEQIRQLKELSDYWKSNGKEPSNALRQAADTIEALSVKLAKANMERSEADCQNKNCLKEYVHMPKVEINGKLYIDKEIFIELLNKRLSEEKKDCDSDEERDAIDICRNIIANL